jgi:HSP20 family protein
LVVHFLQEFFMFFTPVIRRTAYYPNLRSAQRILDEAWASPFASTPKSQCAVEQDDKSCSLSFDVPGLTRDQLTVGIAGARH